MPQKKPATPYRLVARDRVHSEPEGYPKQAQALRAVLSFCPHDALGLGHLVLPHVLEQLLALSPVRKHVAKVDC